jgi:predicted dinucleotide-binding enzyme
MERKGSSSTPLLKIGILGSGKIGGTLGRHWAKVGHPIFFSSRHPEQLLDLARETGNGAQVGTLEEAASFGDVILLSFPWRNKQYLPATDLFKGKVVIDAMNPYSVFGRVMDLGVSTSSEEVAKILPGARLVKAFNTLFADDLRKEAFKSGKDRRAIFMAGDDQDAKGVVRQLVEEIGFVPVDAGPLREGGRLQEPGSAVYAKLLTEEEALASLRSRQT